MRSCHEDLDLFEPISIWQRHALPTVRRALRRADEQRKLAQQRPASEAGDGSEAGYGPLHSPQPHSPAWAHGSTADKVGQGRVGLGLVRWDTPNTQHRGSYRLSGPACDCPLPACLPIGP